MVFIGVSSGEVARTLSTVSTGYETYSRKTIWRTSRRFKAELLFNDIMPLP